MTDSLSRPVPKFLCVKGILFFSFWQSIGISILVAAHVITRLGPYKDAEHISVGLNDTLICLEMPFFAIAHNYAFSYKDFIDPAISFVARMPFYYAFRDAFGLRDVIEDSKTTLFGEGMDYREFEPAEGLMHQGIGREHRIRAGLRYSKGGQRKYWLPNPTTDPSSRVERAVNRAIARVAGRDQMEEIHAPLLSDRAHSVVHLAPDMRSEEEAHDIWEGGVDQAEDGYELPFGDPDPAVEELFEHSKKYLFGDYNYPCIDVSSEKAREIIWSEEERVLRDERGAWFSPIRGGKGRPALERPAWKGYGAVGTSLHQTQNGSGDSIAISGLRDKCAIDRDRADLTFEAEGPEDFHWTQGHGTEELPAKRFLAPQSSSLTRNNSRNGRHQIRLSLSPSRDKSRNPRGDSQDSSPTLPPDAVDLVVEDNKIAEEQQTRERKKGEPAIRGPGSKKAYRRGFELDVEGIDVDQRRMELGKQVRVQDGDGSSEPETWEPDNPEGVVARAQTPPAYARLLENNLYDLPADENPWA